MRWAFYCGILLLLAACARTASYSSPVYQATPENVAKCPKTDPGRLPGAIDLGTLGRDAGVTDPEQEGGTGGTGDAAAGPEQVAEVSSNTSISSVTRCCPTRPVVSRPKTPCVRPT